MKVLKRVCTFVMAVGMMFATLIPVKAAESTGDAESAKQGVVQVNTVFVDSNSQKHMVIGGAGFIIGDAEGTEYVITCNHTVNPSDEIKNAAYEAYGIENTDDLWSKIPLTTEVVVEGDVVLTATVLTVSSELDMAVLQLPQPIYTRTPLKILTNNKYDVNDLPYKAGDAVYALGYPEEISFASATKYYSDQQVESFEGEIVNLVNLEGIQVIESTVATDTNNYGGPLVNENGYVVGMNLPEHDGDNSCALDSTKITKVLDGLGITYSQVNSVPKAEEVVLEKATKQQDDELILTPPVEQKKGISETMIIVISLIAVFVIACVVTCIILFVVNKDKKSDNKAKKNTKTYNGPVFDMDNSSKGNVKMAGTAHSRGASTMSTAKQTGSDETTVLSKAAINNADGETALLSAELQTPRNLGTLVRKRTAEKISINKNDFILGKDMLHADYRIENNGSISRKHAMITSGRNGVYIQDCNSTNGTFINGTKLESERPVLLNNGDIVKLSNEEFEYQA